MRKTALAGLFVCAIMASSSQQDSVNALGLLQSNDLEINSSQLDVLEKISSSKVEPQPVSAKYKVSEGDSLARIAESHKTTWQRLFYKNIFINHPDVITAGMELTIPEPDEPLGERTIPEPVRPLQVTPITDSNNNKTASKVSLKYVGGTSSDNRYVRGYCTWYAKNRRPDLPNNLGNANTWVARASSQGYATGSEPRTGAVGQQGMHVVYVESVNNDGTVTVSEMNFQGFGIISSRTVPASNFRYIY